MLQYGTESNLNSVMMHAAVSSTILENIKDILTPTREISEFSYFRSAVAGDFFVSKCKSEFGCRANISDKASLKMLSKHLFKLAYNC